MKFWLMCTDAVSRGVIAMHRAALACVTLLSATAYGTAYSADFEAEFLQGSNFRLSYVLEANWIDYNDFGTTAAPGELPTQPASSRTELVELGYGYANLNATAAVRAVQSDGQADQNELIVKEFEFNGQLGDWEWSAGRRISSFGLGNAYRPLDIIQQQDLTTHEQESLTGVNQLLVERYRDLDSFGLYLINPDQEDTITGIKQPAVVARYAASTDSIDWQTLLRYSRGNRLQAGIGAVRILNDALSLYGSSLWSSRYTRPAIQPPAGNTAQPPPVRPSINSEQKNGINWMFGGNWTWSERQNLILEYWHDDFVPGRQQENVLTRWTYTGDTLQPRLSLLYSADDAGLMSEAAVGVDRYAVKFLLGMRLFSGPEDSAYGQFIENSRVFLTLYGNF